MTKNEEERASEERENKAKHHAKRVLDGLTSFDALECELADDKSLYMEVRRQYLMMTAPARRQQAKFESDVIDESDPGEMGTDNPTSARERQAAAKKAWWAKRKAAGLPNPRSGPKPSSIKLPKVPLLPHQKIMQRDSVQNVLAQAIEKFQSDLHSLKRAEEILNTFKVD